MNHGGRLAWIIIFCAIFCNVASAIAPKDASSIIYKMQSELESNPLVVAELAYVGINDTNGVNIRATINSEDQDNPDKVVQLIEFMSDIYFKMHRDIPEFTSATFDIGFWNWPQGGRPETLHFFCLDSWFNDTGTIYKKVIDTVAPADLKNTLLDQLTNQAYGNGTVAEFAANKTIVTDEVFPLHIRGASGEVTIFGLMIDPRGYDESDVRVNADVGFGPMESMTHHSSLSTLGQMVLVDNEDRLYNSNIQEPPYERENRGIIYFNVPKKLMIHGFRVGSGTDTMLIKFDKAISAVPDNFTTIKNLILDPSYQTELADPISIELENPIEASSGNVNMKLYGVKREAIVREWGISQPVEWAFDVKLTNNGSESLKLNDTDFWINDQYGWEYSGDKSNVPRTLLPGESLRFDIIIASVSELSIPSLLNYKDVAMNISTACNRGNACGPLPEKTYSSSSNSLGKIDY